MAEDYPETPDKRYFVVKGRLWRRANPDLDLADKERWVKNLMFARRAVASAKKAADDVGLKAARAAVDEAKQALGERGPVWWHDGAPDWNRHLVKNTPYADWFAGLPAE